MLRRIHSRGTLIEESFKRTSIFNYKCTYLLIWKSNYCAAFSDTGSSAKNAGRLIIQLLSTSKEIHDHLLWNQFFVVPGCSHYKKYYINLFYTVCHQHRLHIIIIIILSNSSTLNSAEDYKKGSLRKSSVVPRVMR